MSLECQKARGWYAVLEITHVSTLSPTSYGLHIHVLVLHPLLTEKVGVLKRSQIYIRSAIFHNGLTISKLKARCVNP